MKIHHLAPGEALASLNTGPDGLSAAEAARRLAEFGANRVPRVSRPPALLRLLGEFTHFFALILWVAAALAFVADALQPGEGMAALGWAVLGVIAVNGLFSFVQERRAERALAALEALLPHSVKVVRDGQAVEVPAEAVVPGDLVRLVEGDDVPADCRVVEALGLRVNLATVTGESLPKARDAHPSPEENLLQSRNVLLAGTSVVSGEGLAVAYATGTHTELGRIAHLTQTAQEEGSPLQREIRYLSRLVAALATGLGVVFFLIGQALGLGFWENFLFAIGIIVANVPEGLLPTVTLSLAMATQRMAKRNALVRHLPAVEALGSATVILTDKTGTLTENRMAVVELHVDGARRDAAAARAAPRSPAMARLLQAAAWNNTLSRAGAGWLGDPMEVALARYAQSADPTLPASPKVDEVAFDTDRKRMTTVHAAPAGLLVLTKGAPETVLPLCAAVVLPEGEVPCDAGRRAGIRAVAADMGHRGLRVLAVAYRELAAAPAAPDGYEAGLTFAGLVALEDPPRPEVPDAIARCREAGIRVIMVTGDHPQTGLAIAREIGLVAGAAPSVITGDALRRLSDTQLQLALDAPEVLFARVSADQKLRIVVALQKKRETVAVTGDGVNDAPALKRADIGVAMGRSGTDVAKAAADIVLLDDNFASIVAAVEEGRAVFQNIRKFLTYILTSNVPELVPYLAFVLLRIPLPLTVMQILAVDLGTDLLPALGLGAERPHAAVMRVPPRPRGERLLNGRLAVRAYLFLGPLQALAAMAAFFFVLDAGGWRYGEALGRTDPLYLSATTATLVAIVVMQGVNVFLCRSARSSVWETGVLGNRLILWGVAAELALIGAIVYTPWGNAAFGTAPLGVEVWLFVLPFAAAMLCAEETRKALVRRR
ncbi:MAG: cation-transporting P-type ATPase [Gammaproteobacteria bacterium]|nr:cation-transporting P-type ATPase [Gammaproteobacteria bacterium]